MNFAGFHSALSLDGPPDLPINVPMPAAPGIAVEHVLQQLAANPDPAELFAACPDLCRFHLLWGACIAAHSEPRNGGF